MYRVLSLLAFCSILMFLTIAGAGVAVGAASSPAAVQGVLDLRDQDLTAAKQVILHGEWSFYWNQLLTPEDFQREAIEETASIVPVPKEWNDYTINGQPLPNEGYATYRLHIRISSDELNQPKALYVPSVATAYKLWVNGQLLAKNGIVGRSSEEMVPRNYPKVVRFTPESETIELVLQVSNFVQRKGGIWQSFRLGPEQQILRQYDQNTAYELFIVGSLFAMAMYHFGLYALRKSEKSSLYFGALCMAICVRTLTLGQTMLLRLFPWIEWEWSVKAEYLSPILGVVFVIQFIHYRYGTRSGKVRQLMIWCAAVLALFVLVTPALIYTRMMLTIQLFILLSFLYALGEYVLTALRKKEGMLLNGIGLFGLLLAIINDILYYNHLSDYENLAPLGQLFFLFTQMINLSSQFITLYKNVEKLSGKLRQMNRSLEETVRKRTSKWQQANDELAKANEELFRMEQSRRRLLSNISHELGTPLTSIRGYIKAMLDGVAKPGDIQYLNVIYDKTKLLHRIINDLSELTRLETRQISFQFEQVAAIPFIRYLCHKYGMDVEKSSLQFEEVVINSFAATDGRIAVFDVDPDRIEQVFGNLVVNALKYTPQGGTIRFEVEGEATDDVHGTVTVKIIDSGIGIADDDLPHIFERFFKVAGQPSDGAGLGLAICKEIIEYHQGTIGVNSRKGEGSTFFFSLPVRFVTPAESEGEA
ncbi:hypothetical protein LOK74_16305 [Brevibacillus humidisoli]|uniref:ATP-binding protein n=1 Tax=Brevibacillus humidisoli TaxID=2895522 RepID=UPI001E2B1D31|nr:ATP-binding protein [Brevibacillus humidisoli]UFJ39608.1 hypothetical protein LOK74_16305 [Brevibacillus humidisoli]